MKLRDNKEHRMVNNSPTQKHEIYPDFTPSDLTSDDAAQKLSNTKIKSNGSPPLLAPD